MADTIQLDQYCVALNYELAGRCFHLVMDKTDDVILNFLDGENVQIAEKGGDFIWENYRALKAEAGLFLVHIQPAKAHDLINIVYILDIAQRLVTKVTVEEGFDKEHPRLMQVIPYFGAIKVPGMDLPKIRHHLSRRMAGEHIFWTYKPDFRIQHIYCTPTTIRAGFGKMPDFETMLQKRFKEQLSSADPATRQKAVSQMEQQRERHRRYPFYEEPTFHIYINDHMNLFSFIEENMCRMSDNFNEGGGGMIVLQDIERLIDMGLCFNPQNYRYSDTYLLTAYGIRNEEPDSMDDLESPYDWSAITGMPSIHWEIPEE